MTPPSTWRLAERCRPVTEAAGYGVGAHVGEPGAAHRARSSPPRALHADGVKPDSVMKVGTAAAVSPGAWACASIPDSSTAAMIATPEPTIRVPRAATRVEWFTSDPSHPNMRARGTNRLTRPGPARPSLPGYGTSRDSASCCGVARAWAGRCSIPDRPRASRSATVLTNGGRAVANRRHAMPQSPGSRPGMLRSHGGGGGPVQTARLTLSGQSMAHAAQALRNRP